MKFFSGMTLIKFILTVWIVMIAGFFINITLRNTPVVCIDRNGAPVAERRISGAHSLQKDLTQISGNYFREYIDSAAISRVLPPEPFAVQESIFYFVDIPPVNIETFVRSGSGELF